MSVISSFALEGLLKGSIVDWDCFSFVGLVRGEAAGLRPAFMDVGDARLDSLACGACPGRVRGPVLLGVVSRALGVTFFDLILSGLPASRSRTEYGPAVAGRAAISGLLRAGRIGAPDIPPVSGRARVPEGLLAALEVLEVVVFMGERLAIAEPGLAGRFFAAFAFR